MPEHKLHNIAFALSALTMKLRGIHIGMLSGKSGFVPGVPLIILI
jgi:hypothetical protein